MAPRKKQRGFLVSVLPDQFCLVRARQPASILQGRQGIAFHLALGAGFLAYALYKFHPG